MSESRRNEAGSTFQQQPAGQGQRGGETGSSMQGRSGSGDSMQENAGRGGSLQGSGGGSGSTQGSGGSTHGSQSSGNATRGDSAGGGNGGSNTDASAPTDLGAIGQEAVSQAQEQAVKIVSQAREQVTASVKTQTTRGANIATVLTSTLKEAGSQLREQDEPAMATYLDQAADQIEQVGSMLDNQEYGQLIGTVQGFAKRQPVLFFAAAVAVGVVGARFLRSSSSQGSSSQQQQQRGPDAYAGRSKLQGGDESRVGGYA